MNLISYEQFAKLRLRDFVSDSTAILETLDWEWMGSVWHNEGIGFTSFSRHVTTPDATGGLEISFSELSAECIQRVLTAIGLPLRTGMSAPDVVSALGTPTGTHQFVPDRRTYDFMVGLAQPYVVGCTVVDTDGLIHVTVVRPNLLSRDEPNG
jgi:hypothetical protein